MTTSHASDTSTPDQLWGEILHELANLVGRGEAVSLAAYEQRYPEYAARIRQFVSALQATSDIADTVPRLQPDTHLESTDSDDRPRRRLGDYRIIREIGRGGMGVVYEAEQISLDRPVALKVLPFAAVMDHKAITRFRNEARAAATLHHPHIVPIYAVGSDCGTHYYAMELINGISLARVLTELRLRLIQNQPSSDGQVLVTQIVAEISDLETSRLVAETDAPTVRSSTSPVAHPESDANADQLQRTLYASHSPLDRHYFNVVARMAVQAADALQHAHEHGVVHRDIKPGNLLIDANGKLWVADFGLARIENDGGLTITGDVVGTLRYMAPEQALGKPVMVDHRADIYALGATLYEMLTLQPAFDETDRKTLLHQVAVEEPRPPRELHSAIPVDMETIVLKAIAKNREERYESAEELADDLRAFLDQRPIKAKPASQLTLLTRWAARHRQIVVFAVALLVLSTVGLAVSNGIIAHERNAALNAGHQERLHRMIAERQTREARRMRVEADANARLLKQHLYVSDLKLADQALRDGDLRQYENLLLRHAPDHSPESRVGIEWRFLKMLGHPGEVTALDFDAPLYSTRMSPTQQVYAVAGLDGIVRVLSAVDHELVCEINAQQGEINSAEFTPDGETLVTAGDDGSVKLWDWMSRRPIRTIQAHQGIAFNALITPDGATLITCGRDPSIHTWNLGTGVKQATLAGHTDEVEQITLSADGLMLASVSRDSSVKIWRLEDSKPIRSFELDDIGNCVAFAPDGNTVYAGAAGSVLGWNLTTGKRIFHTQCLDTVHSVAVNPVGTEVAFGDAVGIVHLCSTDDPSRCLRRRLFTDRVYGLQYGSVGEHLMAASKDGSLCDWQPRSANRRRLVQGDVFVERWQSLSPQLLAGTHKGHGVFLIDPHSGKVTNTISNDVSNAMTLTGSADGTCLAGVTSEGLVRLWRVPSGNPLATWKFPPHANTTIPVAVTSDARRIAIGSPRQVEVRDTFTGKPVHKFAVHGSDELEFSPDNELLAYEIANDFEILELSTGRRVGPLVGHDNTVYDFAFSPTEAIIATASGDRTIRIWDIELGETRWVLEGHETRVTKVWFSVDGQTLVSCSDLGIAFWDVTSGQNYFFHQPKSARQQPIKQVYDFAISPDESWIAFSGTGLKGGVIIHLED